MEVVVPEELLDSLEVVALEELLQVVVAVPRNLEVVEAEDLLQVVVDLLLVVVAPRNLEAAVVLSSN